MINLNSLNFIQKLTICLNDTKARNKLKHFLSKLTIWLNNHERVKQNIHASLFPGNGTYRAPLASHRQLQIAPIFLPGGT